MTYPVKLLTEFVGTFIFLAVIGLSGAAGPLAPVAIGFALVAMVFMGGHISGAHYNPAVTFGLFLRRKVTLVEMGGYWGVQVVAGLLAFAFAAALGAQGGIHPGKGFSSVQAVAVEILFTTALVLVVCNVAATRATLGNSFYGLAIGLTIVAAAFAGGPISGGAFNPAVGLGATFGGALHGGGWGDAWIYVAGPLLGAAIGAGIHAAQMSGGEEAVSPSETRDVESAALRSDEPARS